MPKSLTVGYFIDEWASIVTTLAEEIRDMKALFQNALPKRRFRFKAVRPEVLLNEPGLDAYFYDIGGLCYVDPGGSLRDRLTDCVLTVVRERPNLLVVPYSNMTCRDFYDIVHSEQADLVGAPNVLTGYVWDGGRCTRRDAVDSVDEAITAGLREWWA